MDIREYRALLFAIAASLALHTLTLLLAPGFGAPIKAPPGLPALTAVLRDLPQPDSTPPQLEPQAVTQPRPASEPRPKADPARPRPQNAPLLTSPPSQPAPAIPAAESGPVDTNSNTAAPTSSVVAPQTTIASTATTSAIAHVEPADPGALQGYKVQLAAFAQKYQRYPPQAREREWEGIAEVKLTIGENGRIREVSIASSSGHDILDQEAMAMVRKAAPLAEITSALRNKEFSINLPVVFHLKHEGG
jgi:protein TonB